jgi:hypothetical protein
MDIDNNIKKIININTYAKKKWSWRTLFIYIIFFWIRIYHFITGYTYPAGKKTENEEIEEYIEKQKKLFLRVSKKNSQNLTDKNKCCCEVETCKEDIIAVDYTHLNENIEPEFYNKKKYMEMMKIVNNPIETRWKTRILMENTVRGNIIMFYDTYKQGFCYYSDNITIPYSLLNAVAMRYTMLFRCRDFFMDELIFPDLFISPLIKIQEEEEKEKSTEEGEEKEKEKEKEKIVELRKNQVFAKLKSYREINEESNEGEPKKDEKILVVNKFIYLGKTTNFMILQKPKRNIRVTDKPVSYRDYKEYYR